MIRAGLALVAVLALSGCSMSIQRLHELAEAKEICEDAGGEFHQWADLIGNENWYCEFNEED